MGLVKVMLVGGGSGGHTTPLIAVARELKRLEAGVSLSYVGHRGDDLHGVVGEHADISKTHKIFAGKLRRYHGAGWRQILDIKTMLKNLRDICHLLLGLLQSLILVRREKPDIIFIRGGFLGVPVGWAARFWRIPYITHDSDAFPSLANRMIAKKARINAVALPKHLYRYSQEKTVEVGVPVARDFQKVDNSAKKAARNELGIPVFAKVLFIAGGGLGAQRVNEAVLAATEKLFATVPELFILHQAGRKNEAAVTEQYQKLPAAQAERTRVFGFTDNMAKLSAGADVVVSRAGATALAELAIQNKPVIIVPNPMLTGGHQIKNAEAYARADAAIVVEEKSLNELGHITAGLMNDPVAQRRLSQNLAKFARPDAAVATAELILKIAKSRS